MREASPDTPGAAAGDVEVVLTPEGGLLHTGASEPGGARSASHARDPA